MRKRIYIDMDGTLCRFHDTEHKYIEQMWEKGFYTALKPFEEFVNAISLCIDRNPNTEFYILSAVLDTEPPFAEAEKREWCHRYLPQLADEQLIFVPAGADKSEYIGGIDENCCLIDDYNKNLREWENAGGVAIKFINDINNRGLGAYGGEKGMLWNGLSIDHNQSAMAICLQIEKDADIERVGERSDAFYGFPGDVLPEEFVGLLPDYFDMRKTSDIELERVLFRVGEPLTDYKVSDKVRNAVESFRANDNHVKSFVREHGINKAMLDCLETCYISAKAYNLSLTQINDWLTTSISRENAFSTHPVTPSTLQVFISDWIKRDAIVANLYSEINAVSTRHKKCQRQLFMPAVDEIAKDVMTNGLRLQVLMNKNTDLKDRLTELKDKWSQLTGEEYPFVGIGKKKCKYTEYKFSKNTILK